MPSARSNHHSSDPNQRVRTFSPRAVPQLWSALLDSVGTDVVRAHTAAAIEGGKAGFFGPGRLDAAAKAVTDWHQRVLRRCRLYHFSATLCAHALDCEADWPERTPGSFDFPTPYGFVVLERPILLRGQPVSAFTYGPGADWPGPIEGNTPGFYTADGLPRGTRLTGAQKAGWLVSVWSPTSETARALGLGPLMNITEYIETFATPAAMRDVPARQLDDDDDPDLGQAFKIAFDIATQQNIALARSEPVPRSVRRRASHDRPDTELPKAVLVHDLRPRLAAAIGLRGGPGDPVERADSHYRVKCWPVRPVIDPDSGDLVRRGYIAYRDPTLLEDDMPQPAEVWRGTDLERYPPAQP